MANFDPIGPILRHLFFNAALSLVSSADDRVHYCISWQSLVSGSITDASLSMGFYGVPLSRVLEMCDTIDGRHG